MNLSGSGYIASFMISVLSLGLLGALTIFLRCFIGNQYSLLKTAEMKQKFGALYQGLNLKSKRESLVFTEWMVLRRLIFAAGAVFAVNHLWLQL